MQTYDAGETLVLTIDISQVESPASATYRVVDQAGVTVVVDEPLTLTEGTTIDVALDSSITALTDGQRRKLLTVHVDVVTADSVKTRFTEAVIVQDQTALLIPSESFQTVDEAVLVGMDIIQLDNWESADRESRRKALIEAAHRIKQLRFSVFEEINDDWVNWDSLFGDTISVFDEMSAEAFMSLPPLFLQDLKRAQVVEADAALGLDSPENKRASGILSDTVGETSQMFRTGKPVDMVISKRSLRYLTRWLKSKWSIVRG